MLRMTEASKVEVDMVPYIDIISLLLMFLIIVGEMTKSTSAVKMKLPKADQARSDLGESTEGRIVVQMRKDSDGQYCAVIGNRSYELTAGGKQESLQGYLDRLIRERAATQLAFAKNADGSVPFPVKLRIPEDAPMAQVERLVMTCAKAGLVQMHYAAEAPKR